MLPLGVLHAQEETSPRHVYVVTLATAKTKDGGEDLRVGYGCFLFSFFPFLLSFAIGFGM